MRYLAIIGAFALGWLLIFGISLWRGRSTPKPTPEDVAVTQELDVSQLTGKRSAPGKLSPKTVQRQEVEAAVEIFKSGRDPFGRPKPGRQTNGSYALVNSTWDLEERTELNASESGD